MGLTIMDIAEFCKKEMEKLFNEEIDLYNENLIDKVKYIVYDLYEIDYKSTNEMTCTILEHIKKIELKKFQKDMYGNIIEKLKADDIRKIKQLILLYCISLYRIEKGKPNIITDETISKMLKNSVA